jgi:hypothetical protein
MNVENPYFINVITLMEFRKIFKTLNFLLDKVFIRIKLELSGERIILRDF